MKNIKYTARFFCFRFFPHNFLGEWKKKQTNVHTYRKYEHCTKKTHWKFSIEILLAKHRAAAPPPPSPLPNYRHRTALHIFAFFLLQLKFLFEIWWIGVLRDAISVFAKQQQCPSIERSIHEYNSFLHGEVNCNKKKNFRLFRMEYVFQDSYVHW